MSRIHHHVQTAVQLVRNYQGEQPLAIYLKQFFSANKKYGSKDRKFIARLCFQYFRVAAAFDTSAEETMLYAHFLCNDSTDEFIESFAPTLSDKMEWRVESKMDYLHKTIVQLFPFSQLLTDKVHQSLYAQSFLKQPDVFVRVRPGKRKIVLNKLDAASVLYSEVEETLLRIPQGVQLDKILRLNSEAVVQDLQSSHVLDRVPELLPYSGKPNVWDCCAASGGKSILIYDLLKGKLRLSVTDIRASILSNLRKRLQEAGIPVYHSSVVDLTQPLQMDNQQFDLIICDAPCSGSGTWARTPEQLYFFKKDNLEYYTQLQKAILTNVVSYLKPGGILCYITCSVFKAENEAQQSFIESSFPVEFIESKLLKGYEQQSDSMFSALFKKLS